MFITHAGIAAGVGWSFSLWLYSGLLYLTIASVSYSRPTVYHALGEQTGSASTCTSSKQQLSSSGEQSRMLSTSVTDQPEGYGVKIPYQ